MRQILLAFVVLLTASTLLSQQAPQAAKVTESRAVALSGMYSFLHEGEFVEVDFEEGNHLTGFISRYGDLDSDHGAFLDHVFTKGEYSGDKLSFTTKPVHGVWFEFKGKVATDSSKPAGTEGYAIISGTLTQFTENTDKKTSAKSREVTFKSFPHDITP